MNGGGDYGDGYTSLWTELRGVPFSRGRAGAGGINTRYLHTGSNDLPALILLHGFIGHAGAFIRNLAAHEDPDRPETARSLHPGTSSRNLGRGQK